MFSKTNNQNFRYKVEYIPSKDISREGYYIVNNKNLYTRLFKKTPLCLVYENIAPFSIASDIVDTPMQRDIFRLVIDTALKYNYENTVELLKSIQQANYDTKIEAFIFLHSYLDFDEDLKDIYNYNKYHINNMIQQGKQEHYDWLEALSMGIEEVKKINQRLNYHSTFI